jgi:MYXO-CTERM domain-containing protein
VIAPRRTVLTALLVLAAASPALAAPDDTTPSDPQPIGQSTWVRPAHACGTHQVNRFGATPSPGQVVFGGAPQRTIYLNRFGGTYNINSNDTNSATNNAFRSVSANGQARTAVIPALASGFNWTTIAQCVRMHFLPYNVRIVETEPTSGAYVEAVVGGTGTELGYGVNDLFGIAAADNFCGVTETGIAFNFSETHRDVPRRDEELCATIAHEVGHLLALEHETLAADLMSYVLVAQSPPKSFVNQNVPCGVQPGQNQPCSCTGGTTNSAARLTSFVGTRPIETVPPSITLVSPGDDASLTPSFEVVARATDDTAMDGVTVYLNGLAVGSDYEPEGDEYRIMVNGAGEGQYTLAVEASDQAANTARAEIAVTIAKAGIGETCNNAEDCTGGVCATSQSEGNFCTERCEPSNDTCPDGFSCREGSSLCGPDESSGCCSTGSKPGAATGLLILGVGLLLIRRRRAR